MRVGFCLIDETSAVVHRFEWDESGALVVMVDYEALGVVDALARLRGIAEARPTLRLCPLEDAHHA